MTMEHEISQMEQLFAGFSQSMPSALMMEIENAVETNVRHLEVMCESTVGTRADVGLMIAIGVMTRLMKIIGKRADLE